MVDINDNIFPVLGMGDGAITTLTIADIAKSDTKKYLRNLPSRRGLRRDSERSDLNMEVRPGADKKIKSLIGQINILQAGLAPYTQNGNLYPNPHDFNIYTDYLKSLYTVVPKDESYD